MEAIIYPELILRSPVSEGTAIDAFEIHPCAKLDGGEYEQCEENDPDIAVWGVYVHFEGGGLECIADCVSKGDAEMLVKSLELIIKNFKK